MSKILKKRIVRELLVIACCSLAVLGLFAFGPSFMFSKTSEVASATVLGVCEEIDKQEIDNICKQK
jgi:hypothetical protein